MCLLPHGTQALRGGGGSSLHSYLYNLKGKAGSNGGIWKMHPSCEPVIDEAWQTLSWSHSEDFFPSLSPHPITGSRQKLDL